MKLLSLGLALAVATSAQAQIFRPRIDHLSGGHSRGGGTGSVGVNHGGMAHRDHGHHRHEHGHHRHDRGWHGGHRGYDYFGPAYHYHPRYYYPSYAYAPVYGYYDGYGSGYPYYGASYGTVNPSRATSGLLLGALAGGIIGHNSGSLRHDAWRGAAWGAGVGWLLGAIADANRRPVNYQTPSASPVVATPAAPSEPAPSGSAQPQQVTIINHYYSPTPMTQANSLFGR